MGKKRLKEKRTDCKTHREMVYGYALDKLIEGKRPPEYVYERFMKLKEVRQ